jgi:hypothetical protein
MIRETASGHAARDQPGSLPLYQETRQSSIVHARPFH